MPDVLLAQGVTGMSRRPLHQLHTSRAAVTAALAALLLGATPHVSCICPSGHFQSICASLGTAPSCCCQTLHGGTCCRHLPPGDSDAPCRLCAPRCVRIVTANLTYAGQEHLSAAPGDAAAAYGAAHLAGGAQQPKAWKAASACPFSGNVGPPVDRVIALQRLTI